MGARATPKLMKKVVVNVMPSDKVRTATNGKESPRRKFKDVWLAQ